MAISFVHLNELPAGQSIAALAAFSVAPARSAAANARSFAQADPSPPQSVTAWLMLAVADARFAIAPAMSAVH